MTLTTSYQLIGTGGNQTFGGTTARIDLYAKYNSQSIGNNTTNWSIEARLITSSGYIGEYTGTTLALSGDGISSSQSCGTGNFTSRTLGSASGTTGHNGDGTKSVSASASINFTTWGKTLTVSGSATLPTIPRYATITSFTVSKRDETSVKYNFSANADLDYAKYSTDNGSTWHDLPTTNIVSGLSANTTYNFKLQVRRTDSQLWTTSSTVQQTTYNYPYVSAVGTSELKIGNQQTLTLYNPLSRNVTVYMKKTNTSGTQLYSGTTTGTSKSFTPSASTLYASIPSSQSATCVYYCTYSSHTVSTKSGTYKITGNETPTFSNYTYEDTDTTTLPLTGNNQILVNGNSNCLFTVSTENKAEAKNSATMSKYICYWGSKSEEVAYSSSSNVTKSVDNSTSGTLKITAVDSRGLTTTVTKTASYVPYTNAIINNLETQRKDGVDAKTYIKGKFTIYNGSWNASSSADSMNRLKYVGYSVYINDAWSQYYDITSQVLNVATVSEEGNTKTYEFNFSNEIQIHANGSSGGFTVGTEYRVKFLIKDGNSTATFTPSSYQATYEAQITDGSVAMCIHKDSNSSYHYGMNCMSDDDYMFKANDNPLIDNNGNLILNQTVINTIRSELLNSIYPVGSIYMSVNSTSPATLFGGTWERLKSGFIYGSASDSYSTGNGTGTSTGASTGNTGSTTLTVDQIPSHNHGPYGTNTAVFIVDGSGNSGAANLTTGGGGYAKSSRTASRGGGQGHTHSLNSHTHTIPYIAVLIWKRTA